MKTINVLKYSVGIDVSKRDFKCCICTIDHQQQVRVKSSTHFLNNMDGYEALLRWVSKHYKAEAPIVYSMEATGIYHEALALFLYRSSACVSVVLPSSSKGYLKSLGNKSKTDKIDAQGLATMAAQQALTTWQPFSEGIYGLRQMTRYIEDLNGQRTIARNQLHALQHSMYAMEELQNMLKDHIAFIEKKIKELKQQVEQIIKADEKLWERVKHLMTIKGIGLYTLAVVIAETNGFDLFENIAQLTSYAGYDVIETQSGQYNGRKRISKKGNSHIRRALHMPSLSLIRYKVPIFHPLYERVYAKTNMKMKGIVAVQRKMLTIIYTLWKKQEDFNPNIQMAENTVATTSVATQDELLAETTSSLSVYQS